MKDKRHVFVCKKDNMTRPGMSLPVGVYVLSDLFVDEFRGLAVGAIAFVMSVTALSLPSMSMLSKAVKPKLLFWFIFIVVVGVMIIGFVFNDRQSFVGRTN